MKEHIMGENKAKLYRNTSMVFASTMVYALLRYNVFGPVALTDIPMLISNKAIAFSIVVLLLMAFFSRLKGKHEISVAYFKKVRILVFIHVLISIILLSQQYYPKLLIEGKFSLFGNLALLFGVFTFVFLMHNKSRLPFVLAYVLAAVHLLFIGAKGWFDVSKWNGHMPPITLICFLLLVYLIVISVWKKNQLPKE